MAMKRKVQLTAENAIQLGGVDKQGKSNPKSIEGYFLGSKETPDSGYGPGKLHIFQTEKGSVGVWGKTNSDRLLSADHLGQRLILTFTGMSKPKKGKRPAYLYNLDFDVEDTIDVSGVSVQEAELTSEPEDSEASSEEVTFSDEDTEALIEEALAPAPQRASAPVKGTPAASSSESQAKTLALLARAKANLAAPRRV